MDQPSELPAGRTIRRPTGMIHALILVMAVAGAMWIEYGIHELRLASNAREASLREFQSHAAGARSAPERDVRGAAERLRDCLQHQDWFRSLGAPRPNVDMTPAGPIVRFTKGAQR